MQPSNPVYFGSYESSVEGTGLTGIDEHPREGSVDEFYK